MTKSPLAWLFGVALPLAAVGCGNASREEARSTTEAWVAQHADRWEVAAGASEGAGVTSDFPTCINGLVTSRTSTPRAALALTFDCPENDVVDLAWLRAHARGYDLTLNVPIDAPGWTFEAHSPSTAFAEGLTFESWQNETLVLRLETPMFAVWGQSQSPTCVQARMGPDAPLPESCWVDVPWEGTAVVHVDLPFGKETLRAPPPVRQ